MAFCRKRFDQLFKHIILSLRKFHESSYDKLRRKTTVAASLGWGVLEYNSVTSRITSAPTEVLRYGHAVCSGSRIHLSACQQCTRAAIAHGRLVTMIYITVGVPCHIHINLSLLEPQIRLRTIPNIRTYPNAKICRIRFEERMHVHGDGMATGWE